MVAIRADRNDALKALEDLEKQLDQIQIDLHNFEQQKLLHDLEQQELDIAMQEGVLQDIETKMNEIFAKAKTNVDELKEEPSAVKELREFKF